tara:strand:- start:334 stop:531 length:198 start_codon:yes stop_codon:yes gene_type:complete
MYTIILDGTKAEFCEKLQSYKDAKSNFNQTVGVPAPKAIFPVLKIVQDNIQNDDYKLITIEQPDE